MENQTQEQPQQEEFNPTLVFQLTLADVNAVLAALSKAPLEYVFGVYMALRNDAERQIAVLKAEAEPSDGAGE